MMEFHEFVIKSRLFGACVALHHLVVRIRTTLMFDWKPCIDTCIARRSVINVRKFRTVLLFLLYQF